MQVLAEPAPLRLAPYGEVISCAVRTPDGAILEFFSPARAVADQAARTGGQQLDVATSNLDALDTSLRSFKSQLQDADIEKAVSELVGRQTAYQAAMLATSRVMSLNLADYLR